MVDDALAKSRELTNKVGQHIFQVDVDAAEQHAEAIKSCYMGLPNGADWLAEIKQSETKNWNKFLGHAEATIVSNKGVLGLQKSLEELGKAPVTDCRADRFEPFGATPIGPQSPRAPRTKSFMFYAWICLGRM